MKLAIYVFSFLIISSSISSISFGQTDSLYYHGGLNDLIESAISDNSRLSPIEYKRRAELTKENQLSFQPSPGIEFTLDLIPLGFDSKPRYKTMLSQELILSDKLEQSGMLGKIGAREQEILRSRLQLELVRDIKLNYFNLFLVERMLEFNDEYQGIISNIIKSQEINYAVGRGVQNHILKSSNELRMLEFERIDLETNREIYINNLSVLSNRKLDTNYTTRNVNMILVFASSDFDTSALITQMTDNNPEFKLVENKIQQSRIERNIAGTERVPNIMLKAGHSYTAELDKNFLMFGVGINLPFVPWNSKRIDAKVEETELQERQYSEEYKTILQYLANDIKNKISAIKGTYKRSEYLADILLPQTDLVFKSTLEAYVTATDDFLNLIDSYRSLRSVNLMLLEEEANYLKEVSELEYIVGKQIFEIN